MLKIFQNWNTSSVILKKIFFQLCEIIDKCLIVDHKERPSAKQIFRSASDICKLPTNKSRNKILNSQFYPKIWLTEWHILKLTFQISSFQKKNKISLAIKKRPLEYCIIFFFFFLVFRKRVKYFYHNSTFLKTFFICLTW